jgi:hypothetical protein
MYEGSGFYLNELTLELDEYLTDKYKKFDKDNKYFTDKTYIMKHLGLKNIWAIRKFGATRGHILINKNFVIKEIEISKGRGYADGISNISCYQSNILKCVDLSKYLYCKLKINEEVFNEKIFKKNK